MRHGETERPGGLEIDHQLEFGRLLHRQVGGLGRLEDLSDVNANLAISSGQARSIADQATDRGELAPLIDPFDTSISAAIRSRTAWS